MIKDIYGNARFYGIYRGVVYSSDDPLNLHRLQLKVPQILADQHTEWAWPVEKPGVTTNTPKVGQGVWVMFEGGDPSYPIWAGTFGAQSAGVKAATVTTDTTNSVITTFDPLSLNTNVIPSLDNTFTLGNLSYRWKDIFLGPGTINILDQSLGNNATISVKNGVLNINGIIQAQLPNIQVTNLTFNDSTVQTSASAPIQYINAYSNVDQTGSTTAGTPVTFNQVDIYKGISVVSNSRLTVTKTGVYNIQFSVQLENTNKTTPYDGTFWVRVNGVDQEASTGIVTCPSKTGASNGTVVAGWNYLQALTAGQYVELVWIKENAAINLSSVAAKTSPAVPSSPSAAITLSMVA